MSRWRDEFEENSPPVSRRGFFTRVADGIHGAALAALLGKDLFGDAAVLGAEAPPPADGVRSSFDLKPRPAHFAPRARAVIHLVMQGGPSQVDLFDPKPQ